MKLAMDDSNNGFVCSSSKSNTITDSEICQLNESVYQLHKPEGEPTMQVLFFHGFQYRKYDDVHLSTWKSRCGSHLWPQTWLVQEFPGAHVFCVSYDARVEMGAGNFDLYNIAENLTLDLVQANIGQVDRCPVILVGHCFGGLVIKKLCLHAHEAIGSERDSSGSGLKFRKFLKNVKGIFYYATPHHGVSLNILPCFGREGPLLQFVKTLSKHPARVNNEFNALRHRHAWRVAGVGESLPTKWGLLKKVVVVREASARDGVDIGSFNLVEEADHFSISKPASKISRSFSALTKLIDSIALDLKDNLPVHECQGPPYYPVDLERQALNIQEKLKGEQVSMGIVGTGGIGKTTLAKQLFNDISRKLEYTCFLENAKPIEIDNLGDRHKTNPDLQAKLVKDDYRLRIPGKLYNITQTMSLSFDTLKCATNEFTQVLGRGMFGVVYKGTLQDETKIAVKKLLDNERGLRDFEVEVTTLGNINHANVVALLGFCFEDNQPFVIYEYMSNGSLDRWIFKKDKADFVMPWKIRFNIVRGVAKGLAYLHEDLQIGQAIIHLDIKPENILLDESFIPKVADFGLAKLVVSKRSPQSLDSMASGGTIGYMAPEVFTEAATTRMDVYSFGMVLLEVLSGRRHLDRLQPRDSVYMPAWAIRKAILGKHLDVIDPLLRVDEGFDAEEATRLILVALLCLRRDPDNRPEMSSVLKMMVDLTIPVELPLTLKSELEMAERFKLGFRYSRDGYN